MKGHLNKTCWKGSKRDFSSMVTPWNRTPPPPKKKNIYIYIYICNLEETDNIASDD